MIEKKVERKTMGAQEGRIFWNRERSAEDRERRGEYREQKAENREQGTENREQRTVRREQRASSIACLLSYGFGSYRTDMMRQSDT
jgi:hypothetical protein